MSSIHSNKKSECPRCGFPDSAPEIVAALPTPLCPELRRSNTVPSDLQYLEFCREIETATRAFSVINEKIEHLVRVYDNLAARRQELQDFLADHRRVVAPIRKIPNELLSEIFLQCTERNSSCKWNPRTDPEWVLVQVCSRWRAIALSTPRMWRQFFFPASWTRLDSYGIPSSGSVKAIISLQLERSAEAPLAINFTGDPFCLPGNPREIILDPLFRVAHRWQEAELRLGDLDLGHFIAPTYTTSFPSLKTLCVKNRGQRDPFVLFKSTPLLKELGYGDQHIGNYPPSLSRINALPLSHLQKLCLKTHLYTVLEIRDVLQSASEIIELSLDDLRTHDTDTDTWITFTPITLRNLRTLSVCNGDTRMLPHIAVPALQELTITEPSKQNGNVMFLNQFGPSLNHLTLRKMQSHDTILQILNMTPHVTHLAVECPWDCCNHPDLIHPLTCGPGERNLVPGLVSLELAGLFEPDVGLLVSMFQSRCTAGPLRSVMLLVDSEQSRLSDPGELEGLRDEGLEITIV
ncbi:hypothetical protein B0H11DRAFT_1372679 [Mycena galericulata]|nr:hypothetical protein B0H11DRAFT_1369447 [Mycena galericulata]KAJ7471565.1 hypothetical protein B0H11DRAFT_1372679 [Mycena galericulata]